MLRQRRQLVFLFTSLMNDKELRVEIVVLIEEEEDEE